MHYTLTITLFLLLSVVSCTDSTDRTNNTSQLGGPGEPCLPEETCDGTDLVCIGGVCERDVDPCDVLECGDNAHCEPSPFGEEPACVCDAEAFAALDGTCHTGAPLDQRQFFNVTFPTPLEDRYYYLYIPEDYEHSTPVPLLVDLHGTATDSPELAYGLEDARASASRKGYILLRPRSRSSQEDSYTIYRWDQNPGDTDENNRFIHDLVNTLSTNYHLDPGRLYIMGFSSGTNQTARALVTPETVFSGFGFLGGGLWLSGQITYKGNLYMATGFRDYMRPYHYNLMARALWANYPQSAMFNREFDGGHELYGFLYDELFDFLDTGLAPDPGQLDVQWHRESFPDTTTLLTLGRTTDGTVLAGGAQNSLYRRSADGAWQSLDIDGVPAFEERAFTDICVSEEGPALALGEGQLARSSDGGRTWSHQERIGETDSTMFGYQFLNGVTCGSGLVVATGYWQGASSNDGGVTWADLAFPTSYGGRAQGAFVTTSSVGTFLAGGYYAWLAVSGDGTQFTPSTVDAQAPAHWYYDAAAIDAGRWATVGDFGTILLSDDDGATFRCGRCDGGPSLYAVAFTGERGLAVGHGGAAFLTEDGGETWEDVSCGLDAMLSDVLWLTPQLALVVGEGGTVLTLDVSTP